MSVIIEEINAEVESNTHHGGGEGEVNLADNQQVRSIIELLEMTQERKARLAID